MTTEFEKNELTDQEIEDWKKKIDAMTHSEMASLWRFAPSGHPVFRNDLPLLIYFNERFKALGGMTASVSKQVGWPYECY